MRASSKRYCITPKDPFYLIGYQASYASRGKPAEGVHDDIYAQPTLINVDGKYIYIFQADLIEFEDSFCRDVKSKLSKKFDLDENLILFSATHNHSAVMDYHKTWKFGKFSPKYYDFLVETVVKGFEECCQTLEEVKVFFGKGLVTGYYGSRIHLGELADNEVILVEFRNDAGDVIASICNWSTHSTVISPENDLLTAEFAGNVAQEIGKIKGYIPAMIVGAAGDCSNRAFRQGTGYEELKRVSVGCAEQICAIPVDNEIEIEYEYDKMVTHRIQYIPEINENEIKEKIIELEKMHRDAVGFNDKKIYFDRIRALKNKLTLGEVDVTLFSTIIKLRDMEIISIPGELGSRYGIEIKEKSSSKCCLIFGYTNGHYGYLLPSELYDLSFETLGSKYRSSDVAAYVNVIENNL